MQVCADLERNFPHGVTTPQVACPVSYSLPQCASWTVSLGAPEFVGTPLMMRERLWLAPASAALITIVRIEQMRLQAVLAYTSTRRKAAR